MPVRDGMDGSGDSCDAVPPWRIPGGVNPQVVLPVSRRYCNPMIPALPLREPRARMLARLMALDRRGAPASVRERQQRRAGGRRVGYR